MKLEVMFLDFSFEIRFAMVCFKTFKVSKTDYTS